MSAVIPFPGGLVVRHAVIPGHTVAKSNSGRELFVSTSIRSYCHNKRYSDAVCGTALQQAMALLRNGQSKDAALAAGMAHADQLHQTEVEVAWGDDTR